MTVVTNFALHTRLTGTTVSGTMPAFVNQCFTTTSVGGDHGWNNKTPPTSPGGTAHDHLYAVYTINFYSDLTATSGPNAHPYSYYHQFSAINCDGEWKTNGHLDPVFAKTEVQNIRAWIDTYNADPTNAGFPLLFHCFCNPDLIDPTYSMIGTGYAGDPTISRSMDLLFYGSVPWTTHIESSASAIRTAINGVSGKRAGFRLGILLSNYTKAMVNGEVIYTMMPESQIVGDILEVVDVTHMNLDVVSFYYNGDASDNIITAVNEVRNITTPPPPPGSMTIVSVPNSGYPLDTFTVTVTGFDPGEAVTVFWGTVLRGVVMATPTADGSGNLVSVLTVPDGSTARRQNVTFQGANTVLGVPNAHTAAVSYTVLSIIPPPSPTTHVNVARAANVSRAPNVARTPATRTNNPP